MPYPPRGGKSAFQRDKTLDQKDYSMTAMAALKAAVETYGYELELGKITGELPAVELPGSPSNRIIELHELYFELLMNKVPGDVPAAFTGSTVAPESQLAEESVVSRPMSAGTSTLASTAGSSGSGRIGPGDLVINFGKYNGKSVAIIDSEDPGYVRWLADKAQDANVQRIVREYLDAKYEAADAADPFAA